MAAPVELSGIAVVCAGSFNPAIFQPDWLATKELVPPESAAAARDGLIVTPQLAAFTADWLSIQVTADQAAFTTVDEGRDLDLRDFARSVLTVLPETPVDAVGINSDAHFRVDSEEAWHTLGDRFAPKDFWEPLFEGDTWKKRPDDKIVGLRSITVEASRDDLSGLVRVEVGPSVRVGPL